MLEISVGDEKTEAHLKSDNESEVRHLIKNKITLFCEI